MHCEQFEARWQRLLDERRSPGADPHLLAHSITCEACASMLDAGEAMLVGLGDDCPDLRDDFAEHVVMLASSHAVAPAANLQAAGRIPSPTAFNRTAWVWNFAAPAAGMALAAMLMAFYFGGFGRSTASPASSLQTATIAGAIVPDVESGLSFQPNSSPQTAVAAEESTRPDLQSLLLELAERFPKDEAARALSAHMQKLDSAARPLAKSFGTAFTAIYRSVGKGQASGKSAQAFTNLPNVA